MSKKQVFLTLEEYVNHSQSQLLKSLGTLSPAVSPIIQQIIHLNKSAIKNITKNTRLTELDLLQLFNAYKHYAQISEMAQVLDLVRQRSLNHSIYFDRAVNQLKIFQELEKTGHYCFPEYVNFDTRWSGPRLPTKKNLTRWLAGHCTALTKTHVGFTVQEQVKGKIITSYLEITRPQFQKYLKNQKISLRDFVEIHLYKSKLEIIIDPFLKNKFKI